MKTYLITGCAGFIGSNFVHYMLKKYPEILLVNLDKLTYAGNLENLKDVEGDPRHVFVQGDICDKELVEGLFQKYDFDYVINFAAESHVDRSIKNPEIFVQSNVMGTVNLLQRAKEAWYDADAKTWKEGKKYPEILLVNLDKLTYAGNLENLKDVEGDPRHVFVQGDICDKELVESLFAKYDFDYVINFAAESHVDRSIKNPEIFVQSNVMGTVNLLQRAKEAWYDADAKTWKDGKKYLQVSTDEVYGALGAEGFFMETTPLCPHSPYSSSKASADMFVMAFHDTYGMPINITRCSNNYGPYQFPEKLIPLMINNVKHHKQLPVYGDGMQIRDWLYVEDHCKAIDMVCNGGKVGEVYNVGGHNERPNIFIVKTIIEQLHDRLKDDGISEDLIKHVADRLGHDRRYGIDPTKIKNDLGWYPETPFEKGIVLTIDWYLDHEEWMEHITSGNYQKYYEEMYKNK